MFTHRTGERILFVNHSQGTVLEQAATNYLIAQGVLGEGSNLAASDDLNQVGVFNYGAPVNGRDALATAIGAGYFEFGSVTHPDDSVAVWLGRNAPEPFYALDIQKSGGQSIPKQASESERDSAFRNWPVIMGLPGVGGDPLPKFDDNGHQTNNVSSHTLYFCHPMSCGSAAINMNTLILQQPNSPKNKKPSIGKEGSNE